MANTACGELTMTIDPPCPCLTTFAARRTQAVKSAPHRDVDGAAKTLHVGFEHQLAIAVGRVRDEEIDAAEFGGHLGHHLFHGFQIGHVGPQQDGLRTGGPHLFGDFLEPPPDASGS